MHRPTMLEIFHAPAHAMRYPSRQMKLKNDLDIRAGHLEDQVNDSHAIKA